MTRASARAFGWSERRRVRRDAIGPRPCPSTGRLPTAGQGEAGRMHQRESPLHNADSPGPRKPSNGDLRFHSSSLARSCCALGGGGRCCFVPDSAVRRRVVSANEPWVGLRIRGLCGMVGARCPCPDEATPQLRRRHTTRSCTTRPARLLSPGTSPQAAGRPRPPSCPPVRMPSSGALRRFRPVASVPRAR